MEDAPNSGCLQPSQSDRVSAAWQKLHLVLSFFPRVDAKLSVVHGINLGLSAILVTLIPRLEHFTLGIAVLSAAFIVPLAISFWYVWWGHFPNLHGGHGSLIYFGSISRMSQDEFRGACAERTLADMENDLLNQCWRNSQILDSKFSSLRRAYLAALIALVPWLVLIALIPASAK